MGLESDPTAGGLGFVDIYGTAFGRDVEPTVEGGSKMYQLLTSCLRVFRSGAGTCTDTTELCCQGETSVLCGRTGCLFWPHTCFIVAEACYQTLTPTALV